MSRPEISSSSEMATSSSNIPDPPSPKPSSPSVGERLLTLLIRLIVMCLALPLFVIFASVSALLLLHLCLAGHALRRHQQHHSPSDSNPNSGLSSSDLKRMACFRWPWPPDQCCAVCLEAVRQGEMCRKLKVCQHVFHKSCVDRWLVVCPNCPLCRETVRPDGWI